MEVNYEKRLSENLPEFAKKTLELADSLERVYDFCLVFFKLDGNKEKAINKLLMYCIEYKDYRPLGSLINSLSYTLTFFENEFKEKCKLSTFDSNKKDGSKFGTNIVIFKEQISIITNSIFEDEGDTFENAQMLCSFFLELNESETELNKIKKQALIELIQEAIKRKDLSKLNEIVHSIFGILDYIATNSLRLCKYASQKEYIIEIFNSIEANNVTDSKRKIFKDIEFFAEKEKFKNAFSRTWYSVLSIFATNPPLTKPKESEVVVKKKQVERPRTNVQKKIENPLDNTEDSEAADSLDLKSEAVVNATIDKQTEEKTNPEAVDLLKSKIALQSKITSFKDLPEETSHENKAKIKAPNPPVISSEINQQILTRLEKIGILLDSIFISNKNTSRTVEKLDAFITLFEENKDIKNAEIAEINAQISNIDQKLNMIIDLLKIDSPIKIAEENNSLLRELIEIMEKNEKQTRIVKTSKPKSLRKTKGGGRPRKITLPEETEKVIRKRGRPRKITLPEETSALSVTAKA